jgi:ribosomal protein S10
MEHSTKFKYTSRPIPKIKPVLPLLTFETQGPLPGGLNSEKDYIQVRFLFTSFIASDVQQSTKEFHAFVMKLSHLLHIRVWDHNLNSTVRIDNFKLEPKGDSQKGVQTKGDSDSDSDSDSSGGPKSDLRLSGNINKQISMLQRWLPNITRDSFCDTVSNIEKTIWEMKYHGMIQSLHDHGRLKATNQLPQSTHLRTVIRSPHVFKKTREQFGMVKCKISLDYYFKSNTCAQLFINCASLLKLPVEVQVRFRDAKS